MTSVDNRADRRLFLVLTSDVPTATEAPRSVMTRVRLSLTVDRWHRCCRRSRYYNPTHLLCFESSLRCDEQLTISVQLKLYNDYKF